MSRIILVVLVILHLPLCMAEADPCKKHKCPKGEICILREVWCFTTPCSPQPLCRSADICRLDPEPGMCKGAIPRWYYARKEAKCLQFTYGGCGGNTNNFMTKKACQHACRKTKNGEALTICEKRRLENSDPERMDAPVVECNDDGNFVKRQCDGFIGACYCVTVVEGKLIPGSWPEEDEGLMDLDCDVDQFKQYYVEQLCLAELEEIGGMVGGFVPTCDKLGLYEKKQCHGSLGPVYGECWCYTTDGSEVPGSRRNILEDLDCQAEFAEFYTNYYSGMA